MAIFESLVHIIVAVLMFFLSLIISVTSSFVIFYQSESRQNGPYTAFRLAFLYTLVTHFALTFLFTEILSPSDQLTQVNARIYWTVLAFMHTAGMFWNLRQADWPRQRITQSGTVLLLKNLPRNDKLLICTVGLFLVLPLLFLAIYAPPSNYDSHNYHLHRVVMWVWNGNVEHFPTVHVQQLYHNVGAEYLMLQAFLLTGNDRFVNLFQFTSMLGSVVAVSLLVKQFSKGHHSQLLASVLMFSLPIGVLESTTTQNDYIACFFFLCSLVFGYQVLNTRQGWYLNILYFAMALAFSGFTKYPALFFAFPFTIYFGVRFLLQYGWPDSLKALTSTSLIFILVFVPFMSRNYQLFGHPLSPQPGTELFAEKIPADRFSISSTLSTFSKNIGLHLSLPHNGYNRLIDKGIDKFHRLLQIDLNDPCLSLDSYHTRFSMQEDMAPNTLHLAAFLLAMLLLFLRSGNSELKLIVILAFGGLLIFSTLCKFQLWSSRPMMPFFASGVLVTAVVYQQVVKRGTMALMSLFLFVSSAVVYGNPSKMLLPLKYISKKTLAHIPRDVCPADEKQAAQYRQVLKDFYDFENGAGCHVVRKSFPYARRLTIFGKLDSLGYYKSEKAGTIISQSRIEAYFSNHTHDYDLFAPLIPKFDPNLKNVGVLFADSKGYYHYWTTLANSLNKPFQMSYIRFPKRYKSLANTNRLADYNYILADNKELLQATIPHKEIAEIHCSGNLYVVRLKNPSKKVYLY